MVLMSSNHPLELQSRPIGLKLPFSNQSTYFDVHYTTRDQLKTNLKNLILTPKGFRPMNLDFGTELYSLLFNQITTAIIAKVRESIFSAVIRYLPQIEIQNLDITTPGHQVAVSLEFRIKPDLEWDSLRLEVSE